jgi:hypothetical protein
MLIAQEIGRNQGFPPVADNNAVGTAGQQLRTEGETKLGNAVRGSEFLRGAFYLSRARSKLVALARLKSNWDSYGAPAPNNAAVQNADRVLGIMLPFDLASVSIVPSAEGGIGFCFARGERYADIEFSNDGEILGVRYAGMDPPVLIQTDGTDVSIGAALEEVRHHIRA